MGQQICYREARIVVMPKPRRACEWRFYLPGHRIPAATCGFADGRRAFEEAVLAAQRAIDRCLAEPI